MARRSKYRNRMPSPVTPDAQSYVDNNSRSDYEPIYNEIQENAPEEEELAKSALDETEYQSKVNHAFASAEDFIDMHIAPLREKAAKYYYGEKFGNEEDGRSQIVLTEVRDTVQSILPSLMRIFCSGDKIVEFMPRTAEDVEVAEQATDAINFIFNEANNGYSVLYSAFKDALIKKLGVITWWAEEEPRVIEKRFTGVSEEDLLMYQQSNPNAEFVSVEYEPQTYPGLQTYAVTVKLVDTQRKYKVKAVPPESFIIDRRAKDTISQFDLIGYRDFVPISELVEAGFDEDVILEHGHPGSEDDFTFNTEKTQRVPGWSFPEQPTDNSMRRVKYAQIYMRIDKDGDGIAELRKLDVIGRNCYILRDEIVDHAPFAVFCPDPEPHTVFGHSIADATMDLQELKSNVTRAILDSAAQTIFPRMGVVEGQVNIDDCLNREVGAIVRMRQAGAVQDLSTPFIGQSALPILDYIDQIKAQRTGVTPASQGLDADLLQSTTKAAVTAQISAAQERIEIISRTFAETGAKQLFSGLLKLICRHQDKPLLTRLRGKWTPVDPTTWDASMDCMVTVALGRGSDNDRLQFLQLVAQKQETILQQLGMSNPLVKPSQYAETLAQIMRLAGYKNTENYFSTITPEMDMQIAQGEQQAKANQVDPEILKAKILLADSQANNYAKTQDIALRVAQMQLDQDYKRDQIEAEIALKAADLQGKYGLEMDVDALIEFLRRPRSDVLDLTGIIMSGHSMNAAQTLSQIGQSAQQPGPQATPRPPGIPHQQQPGMAQ